MILVGLFGVNSFPWLGIILLVLIPGFPLLFDPAYRVVD